MKNDTLKRTSFVKSKHYLSICKTKDYVGLILIFKRYVQILQIIITLQYITICDQTILLQKDFVLARYKDRYINLAFLSLKMYNGAVI